ncbi:MAG TPA: CAP domain-containing protein [Chthoniobacterales bacterium]|nr:CAP domain-containing protein [Chthoniobacterales bacterium]
MFVRFQFIAPLLLLVAATAPRAIAQTQYSIGYPSPEQQYMLELINRARANGGAEAARLGLNGLQEGPPSINGQSFTIANSAQPLSWNPLLANCAQNHAKFLNDNDQFFTGTSPHTFGGTTPEGRINAAGYPMNLGAEYNGPTTAGGFFPGPENVAENETIGSGPFTGPKLVAAILQQHNDLFTDQTVPGRGHRMTTMLTYWREVGIGINAGTDQGSGSTWDSLYTVQNFGRQTNPVPFVTGVVYQDTNGNGFYDPGEGIGGIRVDAAGSGFFAITAPSGGYSVPVPGSGNYTATFNGGAIVNVQRAVTVANSLNAKLDLVAPVSAAPVLLANVSTRLPVAADPNALIAGFILTGSEDKKVIVRAIGPSLNIPGQLANPTLELYQGNTLLASNDDWQNQPPADRDAVVNSTIAPTNPAESALVRTLPANGLNYTAVVRGVSNSAGIAVVQVYDLNTGANSRLANVSTRGFVQTGDNALFAGTIVLGQTSERVVIRAIGPSLNIPGKIADPTLELVDSNGARVAFNDNWRTSQEVDIIATTVAPTNNLESAIVATLSGNGSNYTAIVRSATNTPGIAVVEVYALN